MSETNVLRLPLPAAAVRDTAREDADDAADEGIFADGGIFSDEADDEELDEEDELADEADAEDADWPEDGIFEGDDGSFTDRESIFDDEGPVDRSNPRITREEEYAAAPRTGGQVGALPSRGIQALTRGVRRAPAPKMQLLAQQDKRGRLLVCKTANGRPVEPWRLPTKPELQLLHARARPVQRPLPRLGDAAVPAPAPSTGPWKWVAAAAAALAVGAGVYFWQQKKEKRLEDEAEEV